MTGLRIEKVADDTTAEDWRQVHNVVIPTSVLEPAQMRERIERNHLEVGYLADLPVGCTTVRPSPGRPDGPVSAGGPVATVIARVLPDHRRQGFGRELYAAGLAYARNAGAEVIETVVLASNTDGLRFAEAHGFAEVERYVLPGHTVPFITLRLAQDAAEAGLPEWGTGLR
jgi:GNAT superfamily N-acetyltransferase